MTAHKDEARELGSGAGFRGLSKPDPLDCPDALPTAQDDGKRFATLQARLALKGWSLSRTATCDGPVHFYVTRWGMARELRDLAAAEVFADQVGAPA